MTTVPTPDFRTTQPMVIAGTMAIYSSQAEASEKIPEQWREFLSERRPKIDDDSVMYGASPCTSDGKIHFLCGVPVTTEGAAALPERLTLEGGEHVVFSVSFAVLRETWVWALNEWLPSSGRKERNAPEFERYRGNPAAGTSEPVEIWIPLEPL